MTTFPYTYSLCNWHRPWAFPVVFSLLSSLCHTTLPSCQFGRQTSDQSQLSWSPKRKIENSIYIKMKVTQKQIGRSPNISISSQPTGCFLAWVCPALNWLDLGSILTWCMVPSRLPPLEIPAHKLAHSTLYYETSRLLTQKTLLEVSHGLPAVLCRKSTVPLVGLMLYLHVAFLHRCMCSCVAAPCLWNGNPWHSSPKKVFEHFQLQLDQNMDKTFNPLLTGDWGQVREKPTKGMRCIFTWHSLKTHSWGPSFLSILRYWNVSNTMSSVCSVMKTHIANRKTSFRTLMTQVCSLCQVGYKVCAYQFPLLWDPQSQWKTWSPWHPLSVHQPVYSPNLKSQTVQIQCTLLSTRWQNVPSIKNQHKPLFFSSDSKLPHPSWPIRCPR